MKRIFKIILLLLPGYTSQAQMGPCLTGSLTVGVTAFYPFTSGSLSDFSGGGHTLNLAGSAYPTADRFGAVNCAYHFDMLTGDNLFIPFGAGTTFIDNITTSPFSVSLWYQPIGPRSAGAYELLVGRNNTPVHCPDTYGEWSIGLYDCRKAVVAFDQYNQWQTSGLGCTAFQASVTGSWHHLAFVYDGTNRFLYVDGTLYPGVGGPCGSMAANIGDFLIGDLFTGDIDDVVMYNRALAASEVAALYAAPSCCASVPPTPCNPLTGSLGAGVLAFYTFGNSSLVDIVGGYNLINPTTAYPVNDRFGTPNCAYHFDKVNGDFLTRPAGGSTFLDNITTSAFSISLWYQPIGPRGPGDYELLVGRGNTGLHCPDTWSEWSAGLYDCRRAVVGFDQYSHWQGMTGTCAGFQASMTGSWHHLAFVYDGISTYDVYVDGALTSTSSGPCGPMSANIGELMMGVDYTGDLDDIVLYNRALSGAEVAALFTLTGACCDSPVVIQPCNPMTGSLSTGLLAFYTFGNGSLVDIAAGNNLINPTTAYPVNDRFGTPKCAYHFDKINGDFLTRPAGGSTFLDNITTSAFSISLWYQPIGPRGSGDYELLVGRGNTGLHCPDTWSEWSAGLYDCRRAVVGFDQYSHWQSMTGTCAGFQASMTGSWHHLAFVYDGISTYDVYVDGILTSTSSGPCGPMSANIGELMMGVDYTGDLDDIAIYNRALSVSEVMALFKLTGACCDSTVVIPPCNPLVGTLGSGVLAFYPFATGSLNDIVGGNNLINPTTAYPVNDRFGTPKCAYHFDKINGDFLTIPAGGSTFLDNITTSAFSISLWYQPIGPRGSGDYELLAGRGNTGLHCPDTWSEWSAGLYDCRRAVVGFDQYSHWQGMTGTCSAFQASMTGSWHHLAFVYDGISTYDVYVDGILTSTSSGPCGPMSANIGELMLGVDYTGDLDDIVIYNRALSVTEVNALFHLTGACCDSTVVKLPCKTLTGTLASGVMAFYPFGYGSLADLGGGAHNLVNTTTAYPTMDRSGNPKCAYHFDKVNGDFLNIPAGGSTFLDNMTTSAFSISLWYQPIGPRGAGDYELLMGRGNTTGLHCPDTWSEWSAGLYDCRRAVVGFDQYSHWQNMTMPCNKFQTAVTGKWHHLAFIYDGVSTYNMYVDGVLSVSSSGPCGPMSGNIGDLMLGVDYTGDLDDIVIYNRTLSVSEVIALMKLPGSCCDGVTSATKSANATPAPISHTTQSKEIRVFPNPSDGQVNVSAGTTIRTISIYTATGQLVAMYNYDAADVSFDMSKVAPGMYSVKITTDTETSIQKVIKK